ncbi:hypothetical protein ABB37_00655 [Leptomonas pyrrhocoris]|uniref:RNA polymerase III RPC4 n=1 Tax=Leptomonas pyrrhocoris TaxID=157538 RepID=A0A0N0E0J6_LEPPY|nr:hypothetical protein ABB37_00655 [Leptomonas pyrrhocoris]XP_015664948.1 hypothetical protein ABB37_00655 [Leptomonas pyrrhocoris]KPA86508.1 hypothetical protein ABB37_00655 [Leptomonas pyrrhocoris]KPA86509.1 hypothetical protein ABB37_00655 [Leptomonas pyrrhocoris]|eukprot:XP_015664947.1 hypothetical protein ABB37_00655 [Leptomonas pyrrhocoris]
MPPKAPNLKFKPKLVLREDDTTLRPLAPPSTDDLSLVQLARLQGLYVDEEHVRSTADTGGGAGQPPTPAPTPASPSSAQGGPPGRGGGGSRSGGGSSRRGANFANEEESDEAQGSSALLRPKAVRGHNLSAHAALQEASRRQVDLSDFPETAPPLPVNSMNTIVSPAMARQGTALHTTLYPPLPLDASLPSRLAAEAGSEVCAVGDGATLTPSLTAATENATPLDVDGTAFLREAEREQQRAYEANARFFEEHLLPTQQMNTTVAAAGGAGVPGELIWMQLPRFHENPPFSFTDLPPGKVGELKVLRSGRMVMEIAGVYYDVSVEGYDDVGSDGACAMAVATQPCPYPSDPTSQASCYELGLLQKKLICTPTLE